MFNEYINLIWIVSIITIASIIILPAMAWIITHHKPTMNN